MKRKPQRWNPTQNMNLPQRWSTPRLVTVMIDPFDGSLTDDQLILFVANIASAGQHHFVVSTRHGNRYRHFVRRIAKRSVFAAAKYERRMRSHFRRYKIQFREGYSLPEPPTPALRYIYDRATSIEQRPVTPNGETLRCGFSGGEYHWREWPLTNLLIRELEGRSRKALAGIGGGA